MPLPVTFHLHHIYSFWQTALTKATSNYCIKFMAETNTSGGYDEETECRKTNTKLDFVVILMRKIVEKYVTYSVVLLLIKSSPHCSLI